MMAAILDLPMATSQRQQLFWIGFRGGQACETIGHPIVDLVAFHVHGNTLDEKSPTEGLDPVALAGHADARMTARYIRQHATVVAVPPKMAEF